MTTQHIPASVATYVNWCCHEIEENGATVGPTWVEAGVAGVYRFSVVVPWDADPTDAASATPAFSMPSSRLQCLITDSVGGNAINCGTSWMRSTQDTFVVSGIAEFLDGGRLTAWVFTDWPSGITLSDESTAAINWIGPVSDWTQCFGGG